MNIENAKQIPIEKVLERMGYLPQKISGFDFWFLSPFRIEKTPSFKINTKLNKWFDHGEGYGGNTLDFVIRKCGCTVSDALVFLKDFSVFFSFQQQAPKDIKLQSKSIEYIDKIIPVKHLALVQYLKNRGISKYKKITQIKEVHYTINEKKQFAIGVINDSNGVEVRSKYSKICLGTKDITSIKNNSKIVKVYEGIFDWLSAVEIENEETDYIILNSITLLEKNLNVLTNYEQVHLFLDNDLQANKATELVKSTFNNVIDGRSIYADFKDYNEFLINQKNKRL